MVVMILGTLQGKENFIKGMNGVAKSMRNTASKFHQMEEVGNDFLVQSTAFDGITQTAKCKETKSNDVLRSTATKFKEAVIMLNQIWDGLSKKTFEQAKNMEDFIALLDIGIMASMGTFIFIALLAIIAALIGGKKGWCVLRIAVLFSVLIILVFALLVGIEFGLSMLIADFCHAGPLVNMNAAIRETLDGDALKLMSYYLTCKGGEDASPMYQPLSDATDFMTVLQSVTKSMGTTAACSDTDMQKIYGAEGVAAKVIGGFKKLGGVVACPTSINPLLVDLTQVALCKNTVAGLYQLWVVQAAALAVLLIALHYAQFSRTRWVKNGTDDEAKPWDSAPEAKKKKKKRGAKNQIQPQVSMTF